ncbi:prickle-like protein 4 isoform X4 [Pteropus vampyrus]|uniref:Prickle-like protein 4 isoform X4 n=1 Tax=Pteropus vampyrus TaxID=132908 RepID=A0A6P6C7M7_PTEVA|nr:prickle-like protein 4 isoform X4 [Pteropus vampyrus]
MLFCAVITCTSLRFYNLALTQQLSFLSPIKLQSCLLGVLLVTVEAYFYRSDTAWPLGKRSWLSCGSFVPSEGGRPWDRGWHAWYLPSSKNALVRREQMRPGEYGVFAARAGERRCWHQACFACQACGQALINLIYFYHNGRLYCGRHHAELLRPRCPACDQLIFSPRCTEAEGRRWHENHFCCQDCAGPLGGGRYALPGGGPCCPSCFESRYLNAGLSPAPAMEGRASLGKRGKVQIKREGGSGLGWAEEGILPGWDPRPDPTPSRPSSSAPDPNRTSQTRISGPAALTARPRPERSKGLPNPPRAAASTAARHSAPVLGTRPPSGGRRRGGAGSPGEESPRRRRARPGGGAGAWVWLQWAAPQGCG